MQRPLRVIAYGFAIWWIWFGLIGAAQLLPDSITSTPSFASARLLALVVLVILFAVDYLRRIGQSSVREGLVVGVTWAALLVANDLGHFLFMGPTDLGLYLTAFAPLYAWIPVVTIVVFGRLTGRVEGAR